MASIADDLMGEIVFRRRGGRPSRSLSLGGRKSFAILRTAKIKSLGNMGASLQHTFRERDTPNADPSKRVENTVLAGPDTADAVLNAWHQRAPEKIRKNAVHGLEYFIGGSPEKMHAMTRQQQDQYFADALDWLKKRHGPENILSAVIHRDETTPHMTVMTIPLDARGKLNARSFVGSRKDLSELQTGFAAEVGAAHGLERGQLRSRATHERVQRVYGYMTDPPMTVELPERAAGGLLGFGGESERDYRSRLSARLTEGLTGIVLRHDMHERATADETAQLKLRLELAEKQAAELRQDSEIWTRVFTAYAALGRVSELDKTLDDYATALKEHDRKVELQQQRQIEHAHQQELERKAHEREEELRRSQGRDTGPSFDL